MTINRPQKHEQLSADNEYQKHQNMQVGKIEQLTPSTLPPFEPTKLIFFQDDQQKMKVRITELEAEIERLNNQRESTLQRLKSWGIPTNPTDDDPALVMVIRAANDPKSNRFICENLHDFYHSLEIIFFDGDDTRNFEDFWAEGSGVDIRFERMSRKGLDDMMNDDDPPEWEGF